MRALDVAVAALALGASPRGARQRQRRLAPAADDTDAPTLERTATSQQRAALIASLWPTPTRQCAAAPVYLELPAPAMFGMLLRVSWPGQAQINTGEARPGGADCAKVLAA